MCLAQSKLLEVMSVHVLAVCRGREHMPWLEHVLFMQGLSLQTLSQQSWVPTTARAGCPLEHILLQSISQQHTSACCCRA